MLSGDVERPCHLGGLGDRVVDDDHLLIASLRVVHGAAEIDVLVVHLHSVCLAALVVEFGQEFWLTRVGHVVQGQAGLGRTADRFVRIIGVIAVTDRQNLPAAISAQVGRTGPGVGRYEREHLHLGRIGNIHHQDAVEGWIVARQVRDVPADAQRIHAGPGRSGHEPWAAKVAVSDDLEVLDPREQLVAGEIVQLEQIPLVRIGDGSGGFLPEGRRNSCRRHEGTQGCSPKQTKLRDHKLPPDVDFYGRELSIRVDCVSRKAETSSRAVFVSRQRALHRQVT